MHWVADAVGTAPTHTVDAAGLLDDPWSDVPGERALFIGGTDGDDRIKVTQRRGALVVTINGDRFRFDAVGVTRIFVYGNDGNDRITLQKRLAIDAVLEGGMGNDRLGGGRGNDVLLGGAGKALFASMPDGDQTYAKVKVSF